MSVYVRTAVCRVYTVGGVDFRFFGEIDMKGRYLANIGQKNHVLEEKKKIKLVNFLLNSILNFDFSKSYSHCKVKK